MPADLTATYPLRGILRCVCGQACDPVELVDGSRAYRSTCGCRLSAVDATTVERLVTDAVQREVDAQPVETASMRRADLLRRVVAEVIVAGTVDDLSLVLLR